MPHYKIKKYLRHNHARIKVKLWNLKISKKKYRILNDGKTVINWDV